MSDSDDELPLAQLKEKILKKDKEQFHLSDSNEGSDEETLADLMNKIHKGPAAKKPTKPKKAEKDTKKRKRKVEESTPAKGRAKKKTTTTPAVVEKLTGPQTGKHELVDKILRRWQYCLPSWPSEVSFEPPPGFISCGFKGLFVGVRNESLGTIVDKRDRKNGRPPIQSVLLKSVDSLTLKSLLVAGIERQLEDLDKHRTEEAVTSYEATRKELTEELNRTKKMKEKKLDKEFRDFSK